MDTSVKQQLRRFMNGFMRRNHGQPEFYQAVYEVAKDIIAFIQDKPVYRKGAFIRRQHNPHGSNRIRMCLHDGKHAQI